MQSAVFCWRKKVVTLFLLADSLPLSIVLSSVSIVHYLRLQFSITFMHSKVSLLNAKERVYPLSFSLLFDFFNPINRRFLQIMAIIGSFYYRNYCHSNNRQTTLYYVRFSSTIFYHSICLVFRWSSSFVHHTIIHRSSSSSSLYLLRFACRSGRLRI